MARPLTPEELLHPVPADIEIAQAAHPAPIAAIAASLGLAESDYDPHGHLKVLAGDQCGRGKSCAGGADARAVSTRGRRRC